MMKPVQSLLVLLLVAVFAQAETIRFDNYEVHRVVPRTEQSLHFLKHLETNPGGVNFWTSPVRLHAPIDIMVPPHLKQIFNETIDYHGLDSTIFISNVQELIENERPKTRTTKDFGWTDYYTFDEINDWLKSVAINNPEVATLVLAGNSYEGRDILGIRLSFSPGKPKVFIEANIHAREWISSAVATYILNELLTSKDPAVRALAESHEWYIFPVFNPDGFAYTHTTDRMWRKTRVPYGSCYGADPNRNWGYHFNEGGTSDNPCDYQLYRGPYAFSEPSTKALSEFISTIGPDLEAYISFHSYSQYLLLPYGFSNEHFDNYDDLMNVGKKAVASLAQRYGTQFTPGNIVDLLYVATGGSMDWVKGTFKTPITYTYELRDQGRYGFILPPDQIIPSAQETLDSLVTIFEEFAKILNQPK